MIQIAPGSLGARLLILLGFSLIIHPAWACKCDGPSTVEKEFQQAAIVFTGKVTKVEYVGVAETLNPDSVAAARAMLIGSPKNTLDVPMVLKATMVVTTSYKGIQKNETIIVYTGIRGASCGFRFEQNKEYTVYAGTQSYMYLFLRVDRKRFRTFDKMNVYWTSLCTRTTGTVGQEQGLIAEHLKGKQP